MDHLPNSDAYGSSGGPAGVIWGFLVAWIGTLSTFAAIAELASMAPVAGGPYHWVYLLAPPSWKRFLSYLTGWVTVVGWQALDISTAYMNASTIQGMAAQIDTSFKPQPWQAVLMTWGNIVFAVIINIVSSKAFARFESIILFVHLFGFFGILIPLVYFGPHADASFVFTTLNNGGGWSSNTLSFLVGSPSLVFGLFGADGAVHVSRCPYRAVLNTSKVLMRAQMSEEIQNASMAVPQALMLTIGINGSLGFAMLIAYIFCLGDLSAALAAVETVCFTLLEVFEQAVQSTRGAVAMISVLAAMGIFCTVGTVASSTRLLWAFARDRGVPFSSTLSKIHTRSALPLNTVLVTTTVSALLSLIALGPSIALNDVLSLTIAGVYSSYFICCAMLLYRRCQGIMRDDGDLDGVDPFRLQWGPWRIREPFGTINNGLCCVYLLWMLFWSFWPPYADVTAKTMNFSVVAYSACVVSCIAWYLIRARKYYHGPVVEYDWTTVNRVDEH